MYITLLILIFIILNLIYLVILLGKSKPRLKRYNQNIMVFVCPNCETKLPVEKQSGFKNLQTFTYEYSLQCLKCQLNFLENINFKTKKN